MAKTNSVEIEGIGELVHHRSLGFWAGAVALPEIAKEAPLLKEFDADDLKVGWNKLGPDSYRLLVLDESENGLKPQQAEALLNLVKNRRKICEDVLGCRRDAEPAEFRGQTEVLCVSVAVTELYWKKVAWIEFSFSDDIDPEHGSNVAYHPTEGCHWTSNTYDTVEEVDDAD